MSPYNPLPPNRHHSVLKWPNRASSEERLRCLRFGWLSKQCEECRDGRYDEMTNKQKYRQLCVVDKYIPLFSQAWWLDAVCGNEHWDVLLVEKAGAIVGSMPFYRKRRYGMTLLSQPQLTQTLGPYIKYPDNQKHDARLSHEKSVMTELIDRLPQFDHFIQNFHYTNTNWLPFYWKGYSQTTCYTYVIEDLTNLDLVFSNFSHAKRKNINKAEKLVNVVFDIDAERFYENHKMTLSKQNSAINYSFELFQRIYNSGYASKSACTIGAIDEAGNLHGALFVVWDETSAYDLISTIDPDFRNSGAASLLVREVIRFVSTKTKKFDFEGSMIEAVEGSFRQFGAIQTPYFRVTKTPSRLLRARQALNLVLRG